MFAFDGGLGRGFLGEALAKCANRLVCMLVALAAVVLALAPGEAGGGGAA